MLHQHPRAPAPIHSRPFVLAWMMALLMMGVPLQAMAEQRLVSSGTPPQLIELFTSEGCSSCPAADRWLSHFTDDSRLWKEIVPVAFHVDYWNFLGWKDRFSTAANTARQRDLYRSGALSQVYTPGLVVDGREWRGFFRKRVLPHQQQLDGGELVVTLDKGEAQVQYQAASGEGPWQAHFVLLGFGLQTQVGGGENSGRLLKHEFVVFDQQQQKSKAGTWRFSIAQVEEPQRLAVAVWVTRPGEFRPLQVVGGWIEGSGSALAKIR